MGDTRQPQAAMNTHLNLARYGALPKISMCFLLLIITQVWLKISHGAGCLILHLVGQPRLIEVI